MYSNSKPCSQSIIYIDLDNKLVFPIRGLSVDLLELSSYFLHAHLRVCECACMCMYMCAVDDTHVVCHDAELVQGGLTIEQHHISVNQVPLNNITAL